MKDKLFKFLFALFIILIPWQVRWIFFDWQLNNQVWEYGRLSIYGSMIILLLAAGLFIWKHPKELKFSGDKFLYLVIVYAIIVSLFSPAVLVSLYYLGVIFIAVLFVALVRLSSKLFVAQIFLLSGMIQGVFAIGQILMQKVPANKWLGLAEHLPSVLGTSVVEVGTSRILRAYGSLPHPNILGGFLLVAIFAGLYLWIQFYKKSEEHNWALSFIKKNIWQFLFIIFSLIICTYGLLASFSRSALLALICALFSVTAINVLSRKWLAFNVGIKYFLLLLILFISFNLWFPGAWAARYNIEGRLEVQSLEQRADSFQQFDFTNYKHLFFGQGLGVNTLVAYEKNPDQPVYSFQPIHDIFILAFAESGIVGVLLLLIIFGRVIKSSYEADILSTSLLLGLIVIGLFDHYLWTTWTGWLLLSFGLVNMYKKKHLSG